MRRPIFSIFCILSFTSHGQSISIMEVLDPNYQNYNLLYSKVEPKNSPFLFDDFCAAEIVMENKTIINEVELKLDISAQRVLIRYKGSDGLLNTKNIKEFKLLPSEFTQNKTMLFEKIQGSKSEFTLLQVLFQNSDFKFVKECKKSLNNNTEVENTGYHDGGGNRSLYKKSESYFLKKDHILIPVKLSKKDLLENLGAEYVKCCQINDCKLNKESFIIEFLENCNN